MPRNPASLRLSQRYQDAVVRVADGARAQTASLFTDVVDPDDLVESMRALIGQVTETTTVGQDLASDLAAGYFSASAELELGRALMPDRLEANAGFTADGRSVAETFTASRARLFVDLDAGKSLSESLDTARAGFERVARHEVADAAGRELRHLIDTTDEAKGWRAQSRGTCGACLAMDDASVRSDGVFPPFHPGCSCSALVAFDVRERVLPPTGPERFAAMSVEEQDAALGAKAKLLRAGLIAWGDLVMVERFREWSPVVVERPLGDLLEKAGVVQEELEKLP